jgi:predicted 3-demethylubiquinone-9 3-methyltransferase (glyoxalase superfamily)
MLHDEGAGKAERVMHAMLQMKKIDIAKLQAAYDGK